MAILANIAIGPPVAQITAPVRFLDGVPAALFLQANFIYGAGGATVAAWVQTSLDDELTWIDVASFSFGVQSRRMLMTVLPLAQLSTPQVATDGGLAANMALPAVFGQTWRVKYVTTGTYSGTTLRIHMTASCA